MAEVDAFLEAHDSGLTLAEQELAQGKFNSVSIVAWGLPFFAFRSDSCRACQVKLGRGKGTNVLCTTVIPFAYRTRLNTVSLSTTSTTPRKLTTTINTRDPPP